MRRTTHLEVCKRAAGQLVCHVNKTGERLPCLKNILNGKKYWNARTREYHDPYPYDPMRGQDAEYLDAIKQGRVLFAIYERKQGDASRDGTRNGDYNNFVYLVDSVHYDENGLRCRIVDMERRTV